MQVAGFGLIAPGNTRQTHRAHPMPICPELMSYAVLRPGPNGSMEMINGRCTPAESAFHLSSSRTSYSTAHFPIQYRTWHHQCLFIHSNTCLFQSSRSLPQGNTPWLSLYTQGRWQGFRPHSPTQVLSLKGLGEVSSLSLSWPATWMVGPPPPPSPTLSNICFQVLLSFSTL